MATPYLSVCFCAYNEQTNIADCIEDAQKQIPLAIGADKSFEVIVVDNASTDDTPKIVQGYSQKDPRVRLIRHPKNMFYSGSYRTIFREAKGEYISIIDGDHQHTSRDIGTAIDLMKSKNYAVVFGWKKSRQDSFVRKIFSVGLRLISQALIHHPLHDINCGYRFFTQNAVRQITIKETLNTVGPEIFCECRRLHLSVGEMVVEHFPRTKGEGMHDSIMPLVRNSLKFFAYLWRLNRRYLGSGALEIEKS
jgi:glycosyltransferase involved in cell wall biosynthesis